MFSKISMVQYSISENWLILEISTLARIILALVGSLDQIILNAKIYF